MPRVPFALTTFGAEEMPKPKKPLNLVFDPKTTPEAYLSYAESLCGVRQKAYTTQDALNLVTLAGYDADRGTLGNFFKAGYLAKPERTGNAFVWKREDIYALICSLESLRRWQSVSEFHVHKMRPDEVKRGEESLRLQREFVGEVCQMESQEILSLMVRTAEEGNRRLLAAVLSTRLGLAKDPYAALRN